MNCILDKLNDYLNYLKQVLTSLEIGIPIQLLFNFFKDGVESLKNIYSDENCIESDFVKSNLS